MEGLKFNLMTVIIFAVIAGGLTSCKYDDSELWNEVRDHESRIAQLEELCNQMNTNISSLQTIVSALQDNDYVTSITPITSGSETIGYTINFTKSGPVTIYHGQDGTDGSDGQDGADGQDGITPQLEIENGYWYVSYDNGVQWTRLWKATGEDGKDGADGKDGDSMFSRVTYDDEFVYLVLADNTTTLMIPRKDDEFSITFINGNYLVCSSGETVSIPYTLTYGDSNTEVAAMPHGGWEATVEKTDNTSGNIIVTAPTPMKDGEIIILASDGKEKTIMRKLLFKQGVVSIVTKSYLTDSNASTIDVELSTNLNYTVSIPDDVKSWISVSDIQTKATMRDDVVSLAIAANINDATRTATVSFVNSANEVLNTVTISQTGAKIANNEIWYISSDGNIIEPDTYDLSGTIVSNTYGNGRGVIVFENDLTEIWDSAFNDKNNLVGITIPDGVTSIGSSAFFECDNLIELDIPDGVTSIGGFAFGYCPFKEIVIPDGVTRIETRTFHRCSQLEKLIIPDGVTYIGQGAFESCTNLVELTISDGVTDIASSAFIKCNSLEEITIPDGVTSIGRYAFQDCNSLALMYCKPLVPPFLDAGSMSIPAKTIIYVPKESVEAYKSNQYWSQYASQIVGYDFTE